mmetsp:Transcript_15069/g.35825  ORF Transcript_15069/g.35825 Transcript_15069/m.35825 type:complete len:358 (-) Transcript_15069:162-1235(-)
MRAVVHEEVLAAGGFALVIDEELIGGCSVRRLYLLEPPSVEMLVQTEVRLAVSGEPLAAELRFEYHRAMLSALLTNGWAAGCPLAAPVRMLCLGLGGGALPSWLARAFPSACVHVAELHAELLPIARTYFGLPCTPPGCPEPSHASDISPAFGGGVFVHIGCARELLLRLRVENAQHRRVYSPIFVDVSAPSSDVQFAAPGASLLTDESLAALRALCGNGGMVALNLLLAKCAQPRAGAPQPESDTSGRARKRARLPANGGGALGAVDSSPHGIVPSGGRVGALVARLRRHFARVWVWPLGADGGAGAANCVIFCASASLSADAELELAAVRLGRAGAERRVVDAASLIAAAKNADG